MHRNGEIGGFKYVDVQDRALKLCLGLVNRLTRSSVVVVVELLGLFVFLF